MDERVIEKFWASVEKSSSCWHWKGYLDKSGLPVIRMGNGVIDGKKSLVEYSPRRLSLTLAGQVLDPTARVQPWCGNKLCLNPSHLAHGDEARFWAKVQKMGDDDCWVWTAAQDKDMYGKFRLCENGKKIDIRAHQYAWQLYTGRPILPGMVIMHKCDHPYCVNPNHLSLGEVKDNVRDAVDKGRHPHGETNGQSKLTEEKVREARELHKTGMSNVELSRLYGVAESTMSALLCGKRWRHVV